MPPYGAFHLGLRSPFVKVPVQGFPVYKGLIRHRVYYGVESWSRVMEWNIVVEWSQILECQKFLLHQVLQNQFMWHFLISGLVFFEQTSGQGIDLKHLLNIFSMFRARMCIRYPMFGLRGYFIPINRKLFLDHQNERQGME